MVCPSCGQSVPDGDGREPFRFDGNAGVVPMKVKVAVSVAAACAAPPPQFSFLNLNNGGAA